MRGRRFFRLFVPLATLFLYLLYTTRHIKEPLHCPSSRIKQSSRLIQKAVFLRYGDADPLTIFAAYSYHDRITVILSSYGFFARRLFCRLFDDSLNELISPFETTVFPEFTVNCLASESARFVALSFNPDDPINKSDVQALRIHNGAINYSFSVCLAPIWGTTPKWMMFTEFMEYYKLQGTEHFIIYKQNADFMTQCILENYEKEGIIEVVEMNNNTNCLKRHRCRHDIQLQDCVARSRGRSSWVATVDLDERISVHSRISLKEYIQSVIAPSTGELRFRCRWVLRYEDTPREYGGQKVVAEFLPMKKWHNTSHVAPINHTTKSVVDPMKVESMGVHQVLRFSSDFNVFFVPPEDAVVRHYRLVQGWSFFLREAELFGDFNHTEVHGNIIVALERKVMERLQLIFPNTTT